MVLSRKKQQRKVGAWREEKRPVRFFNPGRRVVQKQRGGPVRTKREARRRRLRPGRKGVGVQGDTERISSSIRPWVCRGRGKRVTIRIRTTSMVKKHHIGYLRTSGETGEWAKRPLWNGATKPVAGHTGGGLLCNWRIFMNARMEWPGEVKRMRFKTDEIHLTFR